MAGVGLASICSQAPGLPVTVRLSGLAWPRPDTCQPPPKYFSLLRVYLKCVPPSAAPWLKPT
jgi:hypothetical protein